MPLSEGGRVGQGRRACASAHTAGPGGGRVGQGGTQKEHTTGMHVQYISVPLAGPGAASTA